MTPDHRHAALALIIDTPARIAPLVEQARKNGGGLVALLAAASALSVEEVAAHLKPARLIVHRDTMLIPAPPPG